MPKKKFFQERVDKEDPKDIYNFERGIHATHQDDRVKTEKQDKKEYSDYIHITENPNKEILYDRSNPFVKIILLILGLVAVLGTIYYIYIYVTTM